MTLKSISAQNYRKLELEEGLMLDPLNIFVGANNSGKSNLISILRFLQEALTHSPGDDQRGITAFEAAMANFGGSRIADVSLTKPVVVEFAFLLQVNPGQKSCLLSEIRCPR